ELYGVTAPLITKSDGSKMGKTASGAVWLNEDQLPAYDFWQYWRNTDDRDVGRFLRLFTDLPLDEIAKLEKLEGSEINAAKVVLANEVTRLVRGADAAQAAEATASATFGAGGMGEDLPMLDVPAEGIALTAALTAIGFTASNGEAKRKIAEGAVRIDDQAVKDTAFLIDVLPGTERKLSLGKKRHAILRGI
ncbi:MAG: tyrS, partial [Proteobacteria bacterium]|nr:tyrS [Pseudomonadota bacterium]